MQSRQSRISTLKKQNWSHQLQPMVVKSPAPRGHLNVSWTSWRAERTSAASVQNMKVENDIYKFAPTLSTFNPKKICSKIRAQRVSQCLASNRRHGSVPVSPPLSQCRTWSALWCLEPWRSATRVCPIARGEEENHGFCFMIHPHHKLKNH